MKKITLIALILAQVSVMAQDAKSIEKYLKQEDKVKLIELSEKIKMDSDRSLREARKKYTDTISVNGKRATLKGLRIDGSPIYITSFNAGAATTVKADELYEGGSLGLDLSGNGLTLGLWEGDAVRKTHQELTGRINQQDFLLFTQANDKSNHATHVAGTMIASGVKANAKGMAYEADIVAYDWYDDLSEMASEAASGMILSNHSYGTSVFNDDGELSVPVYWFGKYDNNSRQMDDLLYNAPHYLPVIAAGNDRLSSTKATNKGGYDMLCGHTMSKNALLVGAVNQVNNYTSSLSVSMSDFSNWGPTDDGRIKPDIVAKGVGVESSFGTSDNAYVVYQGTSMATPSVTGTLALLQEHYHNLNDNYMLAATAKGLAIHTANEAGFGNGPDYRFGWGLLNAEAAANAITNEGTSSIISETSITNGETFSTNVTAIGGGALVVTVCWTDPKGTVYSGTQAQMLDNPIAMLINDLDVRVTKGSEVNYPWKLNVASPGNAATKADNSVDNVEKVEVSNASGEYTITVSHKGTLQGGLQNFSLIVTGIDATLGVEDNEIQNVAVWPNPAKDVINLKLTSVENNSKVSLFDIHGRMVYHGALKSSSLLHTINVKEFSTGVYFLNVENGTQTFNKKIVIE
ncbi:S8 family serine peptidase [Mangrovimonas sp. DI 80]|uniref:S8 family serine peptidase n=1 Tax=Mangrovimonas sp. DI 80 TaxID=1779330 RepID=UPI000975899E|nr:S8 family serine peptidase [Mangrovimonas sp. DI 80]OMP31601.1 hypothetical protein BKM32_07755 [Mangrovimonas sp. DI 80]